MTSTSFAKLYEAAETGGALGIPPGTYDVTVADVRIKADSNMLFLDLQVLNGPAAGQTAQVNLRFPQEGDKQGAFFHYRRKIAGFLDEALKAAFVNADNAPTPEAAYSFIGDALKGKSVTAEIGVQEQGQYKGANELRETKPLAGQAVPATPVTATEPVAVAQPASADGNSVQAPAVPF